MSHEHSFSLGGHSATSDIGGRDILKEILIFIGTTLSQEQGLVKINCIAIYFNCLSQLIDCQPSIKPIN